MQAGVDLKKRSFMILIHPFLSLPGGRQVWLKKKIGDQFLLGFYPPCILALAYPGSFRGFKGTFS
jgi:hypothetical protein